MNRRKFLRLLGLSAVGSGLSGISAASQIESNDLSGRPRRLLKTKLAGYSYYEAERLISRLRQGDLLDLHANPSNPHDSRAVEVWWQSNMLGHIPRSDNASVSHLLLEQAPVRATVTKIDPDAPVWDRVAFSVWLD